MNRRPRRQKQTGKTRSRLNGDFRQIVHPDGGARPLNEWIQRHQSRLRDGHGSHHNGRHKLG